MTKQLEIPNHVVELTGVICSGKSLAGAVLREAGVVVEDVDEISEYMKQPGMPAYTDIATLWPSVINKDGTIDNDKLRELTFGKNDEAAKYALQQATQPHIIAEMIDRLSRPLDSGLYVVYERPALLAPSSIVPDHRLAIVRNLDAHKLVRDIIERGREKGQDISKKQVAAMLENQHTTDSLRAIADSYIWNTASKSKFQRLVLRWHDKYNARLEKSTGSVD